MTAPNLSPRGQATVDAVIAAYEAGGSYSTVSQKLSRQTPSIEVSVSQVTTIMRKFSPDSIRRSRAEQLECRSQSKSKDETITLASLGLSRVGPCKGTRFSSCGIPLVAPTRKNPVKGQTCRLCLAYAAERRAA